MPVDPRTPTLNLSVVHRASDLNPRPADHLASLIYAHLHGLRIHIIDPKAEFEAATAGSDSGHLAYDESNMYADLPGWDPRPAFRNFVSPASPLSKSTRQKHPGLIRGPRRLIDQIREISLRSIDRQVAQGVAYVDLVQYRLDAMMCPFFNPGAPNRSDKTSASGT